MKWKITLPSFILLIILLAGCSNSAYKDAIHEGEKASEKGKFTEAIQHFEEALSEKKQDEYAENALEQLQLMIEYAPQNEDVELEESISAFEKITSFDKGIKTLTETGKEILASLKKVEEHFAKIEQLRDNDENDKALSYIDDLLSREITGDNMEVPVTYLYREDFEAIQKELSADVLFANLKGYAQKKTNEDTQFCQITDDEILCSFLTIDIAGYREITAIHGDSEDSLRIETKGDRDLLFTNITEDSFSLEGDDYDMVSKAHVDLVVADIVQYQTIEEILDKKYMDEIKEVLPDIDYFKETSDMRNKKTQNALQEYSDEEIEYARVWLDYYDHLGDGPYPKLYVGAWEKGHPISAPYKEDSDVFKEDVITLSGEYTADGHVIYSSNGDGTINVYDIPGHWPPDYLLEGGVKAYTSNIANNPEKKKVPEGDEENLLMILETMEFEK